MRILAFLLLLLLCQCALQQRQKLPLERPKESPRSFLWEIRSTEGGQGFILGSIHLARAALYPLPSHIMKAFECSEVLVLELDLRQLNQTLLHAKSALPASVSLEQVLDSSTKQMLLQQLFTVGLPISKINALQPWAAAMALSMATLAQLGFLPADGIDSFFLSQAAQKKPVLGLETIAEQLAPFEALSPEKSVLYLRATLQELASANKNMEQLFAAWNKGDPQMLELIIKNRINEPKELNEFYDQLIVTRSKRMASQLEEMLRERVPFFAVIGAAHLVGEQGILALLSNHHLAVNQW